MEQSYIVRADHYPDEKIVPLGITNSHGETTYIDRVVESIKLDSCTYFFRCKSKDIYINITYHDFKWKIDK